MAAKQDEPIRVSIEDEAFKLLSGNVKAQEEANRIAQQTLTANRLNNRLAVDVIERYAHQSEQLADIIALAHDMAARLAELDSVIKTLDTTIKSYGGVIREITNELSRRFDTFERSISHRIGTLEEIELIQLAGEQATPAQETDWRTKLTIERLQRELRQYYLNLSDLRENAARYGMTVPQDIINAIRFTESTITDLESQLAAINDAS